MLFLEQVEVINIKCFLEECKYVVKWKKIFKYIIDDIEIYPDSNSENPNEENSDKENSNEENFYQENEKNTNIIHI